MARCLILNLRGMIGLVGGMSCLSCFLLAGFLGWNCLEWKHPGCEILS